MTLTSDQLHLVVIEHGIKKPEVSSIFLGPLELFHITAHEQNLNVQEIDNSAVAISKLEKQFVWMAALPFVVGYYLRRFKWNELTISNKEKLSTQKLRQRIAPTLKTRIANSDDIEKLTLLINSAYRGEFSKLGWTTEADLLGGQRIDLAMMEDLMNEGTILMTEAPLLMGCVYIKKINDHHGYLGMLTVDPRLQAFGIGRHLLNESEQYLKKQGCHSLEMNVISTRTELLNWYFKLGYVDTGEIRQFPPDPKFGIPKQEILFKVLKKNLV